MGCNCIQNWSKKKPGQIPCSIVPLLARVEIKTFTPFRLLYKCEGPKAGLWCFNGKEINDSFDKHPEITLMSFWPLLPLWVLIFSLGEKNDRTILFTKSYPQIKCIFDIPGIDRKSRWWSLPFMFRQPPFVKFVCTGSGHRFNTFFFFLSLQRETKGAENRGGWLDRLGSGQHR